MLNNVEFLDDIDKETKRFIEFQYQSAKDGKGIHSSAIVAAIDARIRAREVVDTKIYGT